MPSNARRIGRAGRIGASSNLSSAVSLKGLRIDRKSYAESLTPPKKLTPTRCHRCGNVPKFANLLNPTDDGRYECRARKACDARGPDPMLGWNPDPDDLTALPKGATR